MRLRQAPQRAGKTSRQAEALEADLNALLEKNRKCTPLCGILNEAIAQVHLLAIRDRKSDRDAVFAAIFEHGARTIEEIIEDTRPRLSYWTVLGVVEELVMNDLVAMREKFYLGVDGHEGEKAIEYHPL